MMEYKVYDEKSYRIHTIKSNRYKTTLIDIVFQNKATFENVYLFSFLAELLNCSCKKYPTYRELEIAKEELYSISTNNLYPMGEGSGYGGGIMSCSLDGIRIANKIILKYE